MKRSALVGLSLALIACSSVPQKRGLASPIAITESESEIYVLRNKGDTLELIQCEDYTTFSDAKAAQSCPVRGGTEPVVISKDMLKSDLEKALLVSEGYQSEDQKLVESSRKELPAASVLEEIFALEQRKQRIEGFIKSKGSKWQKTPDEFKSIAQGLEKLATAIALKNEVETARTQVNQKIQRLIDHMLSQDQFLDLGGFGDSSFEYHLLQSYIKLTPEKRRDTALEILLGEFIQIPAGTLVRDVDDKKVSFELSAYEVAKYEATQTLWMEVMGSDPSYFKDKPDNHPVERVSWNGITQKNGFLERLNKRLEEGKYKYRLLTEAEWEYAAGPDLEPLSEYAWYGEDLDTGSTHPVDTKKASSRGIHNMYGNVWEWVQDANADYPASPKPDYVNNERDRSRVFRGGGWNGDAEYCRSASRLNVHPERALRFLGFRLARTLK